ncbi:hypothetical protein VTI74DRAFT_5979 [Chaetomium olivicolor]
MATAETTGPASQQLGAASPEPATFRTADPFADAGSDSMPSGPPKKPEPKLCGVCGTQPGKYKCPRPGCLLPYCSVACNKQHKENHPADPPQPPPSSTTPPNNTTAPPPNDDPYSILLDHRAAFQRLFERYPSLPGELSRIQETTLPPSDTANNSTPLSHFTSSIPGLGNMANTSRSRNQPWTRDVGLRRGAEALRRARTNPSETGDGVREFCELVLHLLGQQKNKDGAASGKGAEEGVLGRVREVVVGEERGVIERLLREEGG